MADQPPEVALGVDTHAQVHVAAAATASPIPPTPKPPPALCGASPVLASSGKTVRHRLNRGGDRQANSALWATTLTRLRIDPATRAYAQRRTAQGKTTKEIMRCLKRYLARELYPLLKADLHHAHPLN